MPALVKSNVGSVGKTTGELDTIECFFDSKKSKKDLRISSDVILPLN
ncbi:MAG: hypothetical protein ACJ0BW_03920 [Pontiellaceae bacterium]